MTGPRKRRKTMPPTQRSKSSDNAVGLRGKSNATAGSESTLVKGESTGSVSELRRLQEEIVRLKCTIQTQNTVIENTRIGLRCHICLETLRLPHLLVPCGHVGCYECLKAWFLSSPNSTASDRDSELSEIEGNATPSRNRRGNANNGGGVILTPRSPRSVIHVKKFCHHCRGSVKDRPVPVYALRDLVGIVDPEHEYLKTTPPDDLWENIFPAVAKGDAIVDPPFQAIRPRRVLPTPTRREREQTTQREDRNQVIRQPSPIRHHIPNPLPQPYYDSEDHVTRCGICLHEIWGAHCSNERCGAVYNDESMPVNGSDHEDGDIWEGFHDQPSTFETQYESSFIDDDEEDYNVSHAIFDVDSDADPQEDALSVSSDEEAPVSSTLNPRTGTRARTSRTIIVEDSDEDEDDKEAEDEEDEDESPHLIRVSDESELESKSESESDIYDYSLRLPVRTRPPRYRVFSDEEDEEETDDPNEDWVRSERFRIASEDKLSDESEEEDVIIADVFNNSEEDNTDEESLSTSPRGRKRLRRQIVSDEEEDDEESADDDDDGLGDGEDDETDEEDSGPIRRIVYSTRIQRASTLPRRRSR